MNKVTLPWTVAATLAVICFLMLFYTVRTHQRAKTLYSDNVELMEQDLQSKERYAHELAFFVNKSGYDMHGFLKRAGYSETDITDAEIAVKKYTVKFKDLAPN